MLACGCSTPAPGGQSGAQPPRAATGIQQDEARSRSHTSIKPCAIQAYVHRLEAAGFRHYASEVVGPPTGYEGAAQLNGLVEMAFVNVSWLASRAGVRL